MKTDDIINAIEAEKEWCLSATDEEKKGTTQEFRSGFVAGLEQAIRLVRMMETTK